MVQTTGTEVDVTVEGTVGRCTGTGAPEAMLLEELNRMMVRLPGSVGIRASGNASDGRGELDSDDGHDERLMAILGARLLETQKCVGEAAEAIELKQSGENRILGALAACGGMSLTQVLRWAYWWDSTEAMPDDVSNEDIVIELNTDYSTRGLSANEIVAVVQAWQNGPLCRDSMLDIFRRGEVLPEGRCG